MRARLRVAAALLLAALGPAPSPTPGRAATGHADVRLVRLLDEVPDSDRTRLGAVKEIRLRLVTGNVVVLKQRGDFATIFPIERVASQPESLRYFYYVERGATFWIFPGAKEKGIRTVGDGGAIAVSSFRLLWRPGGRGESDAGWFYFPDAPENEGLAFSVVSGSTVGVADPRSTKYWVELGAPGASGF